MKSRPVPTCSRAAAVLMTLAGGLLLSGCATAAAPQPAPVTISAEQYRPAFEAAVESLRYHGFIVDRQDYRFGRITSRPSISPNMLELWDRSNSTSAQSMASTLGDMHRVVTVKLDPQSGTTPATSYDLAVEVMLERKTNPNRKLTGSADGFAMVQELSATPLQYEREGVGKAGFVAVERDPYYEQRLLSDIQNRLSAPPVNTERTPATSGESVSQ